MKLISGANGSGFYAYSANSAAIATNDDLGRKISETYLTAVSIPESANWEDTTNVVQTNSGDWGASVPTGDFALKSDFTFSSNGTNTFLYEVSGKTISAFLSTKAGTASFAWNDAAGNMITTTYQTTAKSNTISSFLSGAIDYVSANAGSDVEFAGSYGYISAINSSAISASVGPFIRKSDINNADFTLRLGNSSAKYTGSGLSVSGQPYGYADVIVTTYNGGSTATTHKLTEKLDTTAYNQFPYTAGTGIDSALLNGGIISVTGEFGKTYTGESPVVVNNTTNKISLDTTDTWSLSAGSNMSIDEVGKTLVFNAFGDGNFPITGEVGTTAFTADATFSSFNLNNTYGNLTLADDYVKYNHAPAMSESATWIDILHAANAAAPEKPNCYCYKLDSSHTAVDLATLSAYDKVTIVHAQEGAGDYNLYWDGNTKIIHSASYCELVKVLDDTNKVKWTFTTSGWTNDNWWDYD